MGWISKLLFARHEDIDFRPVQDNFISFGKVFKEIVDIEPLELPDQLAAAGPLPMEQLEARKDGWMAIGWRKKDKSSGKVKDSVAGVEVPLQFVGQQ